MKELLEHSLGSSCGSTKIIKVEEYEEQGEFGLTDIKACDDCKLHTCDFFDACADKIVSRHISDIPVKIISLEDVFRSFPHIEKLSVGGCCDRLMYSYNKLVMMDMTCSKPEYITAYTTEGKLRDGKQRKAYRQIEDSILKLRYSDDINSRLDSFAEHIALFAYREKVAADKSPEGEMSNSAAENMKVFIKVSAQTIGVNKRRDMGNGFYFVTQKYPELFRW